MKIAILVSNFPPHVEQGTELQTQRMAALLSKKHKVTVYTKYYAGQKLEEKRQGYTIKRIKFTKLPIHSFDYLSYVSAALKAIKKDEIDITQCMMLTPNGLIGLRLKKQKNIPTFCWIRGGDFYLVNHHFLGRIANKYVLKNSRLVLCQTEKIKNDVSLFCREAKLMVVGNGLEIPKKKASGKSVVYVGALIKRKGVENLITAMNKIGAETIIVGDGPEKDKLKLMARKNIKFVGKVEPKKVINYLLKGKIFVLPAIEGEGLPNAVLEAMAVGLPVVATNVAGMKDVVLHGKTGYIVEPGNVEELESHIRLLLEDKELLKHMQEDCINSIQKYRWSSVIEKLEQIYSLLRREE
jgi:glycosyltransferase involved in cell wall biosynthesis